jgi:ribosome-associated heat shock protein Hsp15
MNGQRSKPGKEVRPGTRLQVHKGSLEWEIEVVALSAQRRPAPEARLLYQESDASRERRDQQLQAQRLLRAGDNQPRSRPSKRDRRLIQRFTQGGD